jgi:hypothetical protein
MIWTKLIFFVFCSFIFSGHMTFMEAYKHSGRILCIQVVPEERAFATPPKVCNFLTTPNVVISSAIVASCAAPIILPSVQLLCKNERGEFVPYHGAGKRWRDGSFRTDIPDLPYFNVNFSIVSQVNPHIVPFFYESEGSPGSPTHHRSGRGWRGGFVASSIIHHLDLDLKKWLRLIKDLRLIPTWLLDTDMSHVFLQNFEGSITILPLSSDVVGDLSNILARPTAERLKHVVEHSATKTWPKLCMVNNRMRLEVLVRRLRALLMSLKDSPPVHQSVLLGETYLPIQQQPAGSSALSPHGGYSSTSQYWGGGPTGPSYPISPSLSNVSNNNNTNGSSISSLSNGSGSNLLMVPNGDGMGNMNRRRTSVSIQDVYDIVWLKPSNSTSTTGTKRPSPRVSRRRKASGEGVFSDRTLQSPGRGRGKGRSRTVSGEKNGEDEEEEGNNNYNEAKWNLDIDLEVLDGVLDGVLGPNSSSYQGSAVVTPPSGFGAQGQGDSIQSRRLNWESNWERNVGSSALSDDDDFFLDNDRVHGTHNGINDSSADTSKLLRQRQIARHLAAGFGAALNGNGNQGFHANGVGGGGNGQPPNGVQALLNAGFKMRSRVSV